MKDFHLPTSSRSVYSRIGVVPTRQNTPPSRQVPQTTPCLLYFNSSNRAQMANLSNSKTLKSALASASVTVINNSSNYKVGIGNDFLIWKATKEYVNHRGTRIRVFRVRFRAPFLPPIFPQFSPLSPSGPVHSPTTSPPFTSPFIPPVSLPENSDLGTLLT